MNKFNKYQLFDKLNNCFKIYKAYIIVGIIAIIVGAIFGIYTICNTSIEITIDEMTDKNLYDFLCEDITWITFLFYSILDCLFTLAIIFVTIFSVFLIPITLFVLIYKSYIYFLNLTILFKCLGSFGIFDTIFIILPSYLIMLIIYLIFACFIMRKSVSFKKCGISLYDNSVNELKKLLIILICGCILVSLYEIIMLSIFCNKFIIS